MLVLFGARIRRLLASMTRGGAATARRLAGGACVAPAIVEFVASALEKTAKNDKPKGSGREGAPPEPQMARIARTEERRRHEPSLSLLPFPHTVRLLPGQPVREEDLVQNVVRCLNELRSGGMPQQCVCRVVCSGLTPLLERLLSLPAEGAAPQLLTKLLGQWC